jgi:hypothetical protein
MKRTFTGLDKNTLTRRFLVTEHDMPEQWSQEEAMYKTGIASGTVPFHPTNGLGGALQRLGLYGQDSMGARQGTCNEGEKTCTKYQTPNRKLALGLMVCLDFLVHEMFVFLARVLDVTPL